jgi:hypothetical protein
VFGTSETSGKRAEEPKRLATIGDHRRCQVCSKTVQKSVEEEPGRNVEERPRGDVGARESGRRNACKNQEERGGARSRSRRRSRSEEEQERGGGATVKKLVARSGTSVSALITGRHFITII